MVSRPVVCKGPLSIGTSWADTYDAVDTVQDAAHHGDDVIHAGQVADSAGVHLGLVGAQHVQRPHVVGQEARVLQQQLRPL